MVGNAYSMIEITACNLAIITLPDLHMVGADHEFIATRQYAYCAYERQRRNARVLGYIYTHWLVSAGSIINIRGHQKEQGREYRCTRILHDNEACLIDGKFILRIARSEHAENEFKSFLRTSIQYFVFGNNNIIIKLFKSLALVLLFSHIL